MANVGSSKKVLPWQDDVYDNYLDLDDALKEDSTAGVARDSNNRFVNLIILLSFVVPFVIQLHFANWHYL